MKNLKVTAEYKGHPVLIDEHSKFVYNEKHLANNLELMGNMTRRHDKVYSFKMDLHIPEDIKLNKAPKKIAQNFMSAYCKKLAREEIDSEYIVKMEQDTSRNNPNFCIQMFVDGSKVKDHGELVTKGEKLLADQLGLPQDNNGLLKSSEIMEPTQKKNGIMIRGNSEHFEKQFFECYKQASYLSKHKVSDRVKSSKRKVFYSKFRNNKSRSFK